MLGFDKKIEFQNFNKPEEILKAHHSPVSDLSAVEKEKHRKKYLPCMDALKERCDKPFSFKKQKRSREEDQPLSSKKHS